MKKIFWIKLSVTVIALSIGLVGFSLTDKSEMQTIEPSNKPPEIIDATKEIANYKSWTKVNEKPVFVFSKVAIMCARPSEAQIEQDAKNPHNDKYINVFVNDIGKGEMMKKKSPKFPVGTVIVKEKLPDAESTDPELLTVMIKREKNYNPAVGDWEFLTFNGDGTKTTARGKLESCQACHVPEEPTDFVARTYLPYKIRQKLK